MNRILVTIAVFLLTACGTGIDVTEHVTEKDVEKAMTVGRQPTVTLLPYADSVPNWREGKRFVVTDSRANVLFASSTHSDLDSLRLAGQELRYAGYTTGSLYDNQPRVSLEFVTADGDTLFYRTEKKLEEFTSAFSIPMLIDLDMVGWYRRQILDKDFYVKTPIWYDAESQQMIRGRQFVKVHITDVQPGNKVMPLQVFFTALDTRASAMVWMIDQRSSMRGRDFDALFQQRDVRLDHPSISDINWSHIVNGEIVPGMTKEECLLAKGSPKRISRNPDQGGLREFWYYDGGSYLYFEDDLLMESR